MYLDCMCVHVHVWCMSVCMCGALVCMCGACVRAGIISQALSTSFFEVSAHISLVLTKQARLASQLELGICLSLPLWCWDQTHADMPSCFCMWVLGNKLGVLYLVRKVFYS